MKTKINIDNPSHTFVIAEAGSNWKVGTLEEDLDRAEKLIEIASLSGADAIKFQTFRSKTVYAENAGQIKYLQEKLNGKSINDIFSDLSMPYEMLSSLSKLCDKHEINFMSSPFSVDDAKEVDKFVQIHKIASYENNHTELLKFIAETKKPVLISTGASTLEEISFAIETMKENNSGQLGLLQCTACYPAPMESLNLNSIPFLKQKYNLPVGLSDHSFDSIITPIVAIGIGATIIEKHFTIDRNLPGPDHSFALEPEELKIMIKNIRIGEKTIGVKEKKILDVEQELQKFAKRSIQAIKPILEGDKLNLGENIAILRPGNLSRGIEPRFLSDVLGKTATKKIKTGEGIQKSDYSN